MVDSFESWIGCATKFSGETIDDLALGKFFIHNMAELLDSLHCLFDDSHINQVASSSYDICRCESVAVDLNFILSANAKLAL